MTVLSCLSCVVLAAVAAASAGAATQPAVPAADPAKVQEVKAGRRKVANAAWWGFDPANATAALQGAIGSGATRVIVPNVGREWIVDPIHLASDQEVVFEKGVVVAARPGGYPGLSDSLLKAERRRNVTLRGYGATLRMQKPEYTKGEWRMCLDLEGCTNVKVLGLTLKDSGGDGIYVGSGGPEQPYCQDIVVRDCVMENNRRQGMSVITVRNLLVERCVFRGTKGTAPQAGVDLEPNLPNEKLINCVFRSCTMADNAGAGVLIYTGPLAKETEPLSVRFERCKILGSNGSGIDFGGTHEDAPAGTVEFVDCLVEGSTGPGLTIFSRGADAVQVTFRRCAWRNTARGGGARAPLLLTGWKAAGTMRGSLAFEGCQVSDDRDRPVIFRDGQAGSGRALPLQGDIMVVNPRGVRTVPADLLSGTGLRLRGAR